MQTTNFGLVTLMNYLDEVTSKKLPTKLTFLVVKNLNVLKNEYEIYQESLKKILDTYKDYYVYDENNEVVLTKNGIPKLVSEEKMEDMQQELTALLNCTVELNTVPIPDELFFNYDEDKYDALTMSNIQGLLALNG